MNFQLAQPIVDAVLYEGYILYPYRGDSVKNRQRWTFGGVYPRDYFAATGGADPCTVNTQVLIDGDAKTRLKICVRFLQPVARDLGKLAAPLESWPAEEEPDFAPVRTLSVGGRSLYSWQEAVEREIALFDGPLSHLLQEPREHHFGFAAERALEPVADDDGAIRGLVIRNSRDLGGRTTLALQQRGDDLFRLSLQIENSTPVDMRQLVNREEASLYSFASTHSLLGVAGGRFVSLMDPPPELRTEAEACDNRGAFPVLVGDSRRRDMLLCSPIILYDYPQIAPESPGDLFDAMEIDEILSLRILAMTDAEKREMAAADPRTAEMLRRTEALGADDFMRMHGTLRDGDCTAVSGCGFRAGDRVRLRPKRGGDAMDLILAGKTAVIESVECDFDNRIHLAVVIEEDPGRDWGVQRMPGHRFFYGPEEVELLGEEAPR